MNKFTYAVALPLLLLTCATAWGHGFTIDKLGNALSAVNDDASPYHPRLFAAGPFNSANNPMTINEPSIAPGGFSVGDVLSFDFEQLLMWNGSLATPTFDPAPTGVTMTLTHRFRIPTAGSPLSVTGSTLPQTGFDWKVQGEAFSNHAVQYSMPNTVPDGMYILAMTPTGRDALGNAFIPAPTVFMAFNVDLDSGTYDAAQQAFAMSLVPEPTGLALAGVGFAVMALARKRRSRRR